MSKSGVPCPPPADSMTLYDLLGDRAARDGWRPAYVFLGDDLAITHQMTFEELLVEANAIGSKLTRWATPGDRVLLAFNNGMDAVCLFWGCVAAGLIPVPAPAPQLQRAGSRHSRVQAIAADAGVTLSMTSPELLAIARKEAPDLLWKTREDLLSFEPTGQAQVAQTAVSPSDIAYLQYTSGSTSSPRGAVLTHANVLAQCRSLAAAEKTDPERSRGLIWLPWFHDYGLIQGLIQPVYAGAVSYLMATSTFTFNPLKWLEAIERYGITHSGGPDFAYAACTMMLARQKTWAARLQGWQLATCGAEPVRAGTLKAFAQAFGPHGFDECAFAPSYGLAEAVLGVTMRNLRDTPRSLVLDPRALEQRRIAPVSQSAAASREYVSCGAPLPGVELRIVDPDTCRPCPEDNVGEIWITGASVGRGYWGQPGISEEIYRATVTGEDSRKTYLRTGDLGFLFDGELYVTGRSKDLILVNGRNIYPQDLEQTAQEAHSAIRPAGVIAISIDRGARESVVLLAECARRPSPLVVREMVEAVEKAIAMDHDVSVLDVVPLRIGALPRTSSGKPQRGAARNLYLQGALDPLRLEMAAPLIVDSPDTLEEDPLSQAVTSIWLLVLGLDACDPDTSFFELGGDSLLATQMVSRISARTGLVVPIRALFEQRTLRGLQQAVRTFACRQHADIDRPAAPAPSPDRRSPGERVALSFSQERMWFMHELEPLGSAYNVPLAIRLHGTLDVKAMQDALQRVITRHEVLHTRFVRTPEGVMGEVVEPPRVLIERILLDPQDGPERDQALLARLAQLACVPFRLDECPLLRAHVVQLEPATSVLLIVMHHIVGDQWSFAGLGQELAANYNAIVTGQTPVLPELPMQYADYARWHRHWFEGERLEREQAYWTKQLEGMEPLSLNHDLPRPAAQSFRGAALRFPLTRERIAALRRYAADHNASLSMVMIAALNVILHRHTGKTDIGIGVPIANRHHLASESLLGSFVNTLVFRSNLEGNPDFDTLLARVRETSLDAFAHQDMPFELLVRQIATARGGLQQPLFNVLFNMVNSQVRNSEFKGLSWSRLDFDRASTQFELTFAVDLLYDQALVIEYSTDLFVADTVQRMGVHFLNVLQAGISSPGTPINALPMMDDVEHDSLARWSQGTVEVPQVGTVSEWLTLGLDHHGTNLALTFGDECLTHLELHAAAHRLARLLRRKGVARGERVGVCLPRGPQLLVTLLAVLESGAAYVPLDPEFPKERLQHQMVDAGLAMIVSHSQLSLETGDLPRLLVDQDRAEIEAMDATPLPASPGGDARPEDAAYVMYTSGSTGWPKGVVIPHRAVVNFLSSMARSPGLTEKDRLLAVTTPGFDISVLELFLPLGTGACVVIADESQAVDGRALTQLMEREHITAMQATPSRWHLLLESGWTGRSGLKAMVGGESLTPYLASQLLERCGEVWNMYGPTEATVWSACWRVTADKLGAISLGEPVFNTTIQVLDDHLQLCPIGVPGEICIGGMGLASGYHQRADLTSERFVEVPDAMGKAATRVYRTGDRGRWRHDGSLEHAGRLDNQVKLRGFRIELGEIEAQLQGHPGVERVVAMLREDVPGQPRIVAYIVPSGAMPTPEALSSRLRPWLPGHMIPSVYVEIGTLPLLPNGKTDRRALPAPVSSPAGPDAPQAQPRNDTEAGILSIWKSVLQSDQIGIHDSFFDVGGHSILAMGVVSRIESEMRLPCSITQLFNNPTVAGLAQALAQSDAQDFVDVTVATLQSKGQGPGLFLLAGAEMYRALAMRLGPETPVYGVFSQTEIDMLKGPEASAAVELSVEKLAQEYMGLIRSVQPHGPYFLGGFSIGGALAFEVARRLQEAGEPIGLIVLLDSRLPGKSLRQLKAGIVRRLRMLRRQGIGHLVHVYGVYRTQTEHRHEPGAQRTQAYARAISTYRTSKFDMPAVFLQAEGDASTEPAYGWRSLLPGLQIERVPGKHMDILEPPNADVLASVVQKHLAAARTNVGTDASNADIPT
ncbi:MAG: amino acid adenylation domain-containing protein [Hydrogenophaga sp.]|nr:amino acid adenylation domain-containing protein [Hydrogenophaga sp.]